MPTVSLKVNYKAFVRMLNRSRKMNLKRYLFSTVILFVFISLYEMLIHDHLLIGLYENSSDVWRNYTEMEIKFANLSMSASLIYQFFLSAWTTFLYIHWRNVKGGGIQNSLFFGLCLGIFGGILTSSWYLWLPVPPTMGVYWFINGIAEGLGGGLVLGLTYRPNSIQSLNALNKL